MKRSHRVLVVVALAVPLALFSLRASMTRSSAGEGDQVRIVVDRNLVIPPGETVRSSPVALDGYAFWTMQVSLKSGGAGLQWRPVYRMSAALDWTPHGSSFANSELRGDDVLAPIAAIEFRNQGGDPARVAISAFLDRRHYTNYGIAGSRTVVLSTPVEIPPGQFRYSEPIHQTGGNAISYQLTFPSGPPSGLVTGTIEGKIFGKQSFESGLTNYGPSSEGISEFNAILNPIARLKLVNGSSDTVSAVVAAYIISKE